MAAVAPQPPLPYKPISTLFSTKPHHHPLLPLPSKPLSFRLLSLSLSSTSPLPLAAKTRPFLPSLVARTSGWAQQEVKEEATASAEEDIDWDEQDPSPAAAAEEEVVEAGLSEWEGGEGAAGESGGEGEFAAGEEEFPEPPEEAKLFVGNLPYDVDSQGLAELFEKAGIVEIAEVIYNRETDQSRGFGFITMSTVDEAEKAVEMFNRYDINGRLLTVNKAAPRGARVERTPRVFEPSFRIYVGNLPWQVDDARLEQVFSEHGKVVDARVVYDRESGRSRGFGFVTMASQTELDDAIAALDGQSLDGRSIRVNVAEERPRRGGF